jgi:hypothetical protein
MIHQIERELSLMAEEKVRQKIESLKIFENLNSEKPTPLFLSLTKNRSSGILDSIKQDDGTDFPDQESRRKYIYNEYEKIYKKVDIALGENCISEFLGPEISNHELVLGSKLTEAEKNSLDVPLSIAELDISAKKGKLRSAPGADGFSNTFILRCWKYLRRPLHNYALRCFDTGNLTHNFRSASIRLIPKKGDCTALKNWRPISLLSNFYKIISRAINTRLTKFINRICSRAQKGYNSSRFTQEVLINVWEQITYCQQNNVKGAVVAIDMAKAFDTLSHDFVEKTYEFFNIGSEMRRWLRLLGNNRTASINFGPNSNSPCFNLGRGRPQGDNLSPNTFNFGEQILIFKIELDVNILPIPRGANRMLNNVDNFFRFESNRETDKNESLADDNTTLTICERQSLLNIKETLTSFGNISGLECNFDKSCIMTTFIPSQEEVDMIEEIGFKCVNKINLLGVEICRTLDNIENIFSSLRNKIINISAYWERFRLSLPGRITVAKTFLIAQLNYAACWLKPSDGMIESIQLIIDNFIKGPLNISRDRLYQEPNLGGVGALNLKTFFQAQRCAWIARAWSNCCDNW